ncbi:MAG: pyridoxal phosphate-dependent aminotransferase [Candidatus Manganitrophus sp.]|nr:pyridoxal phosphate-dependent aminotransferase [Candidatus Manganitrophus sp.]
MKKENNLDYEKKEIIVSCGAKHTLYNIAQVLFERGDEVIIPAPYWVSYPDQVLLNDATPIIVETREEDQFLMTPEQLKESDHPEDEGGHSQLSVESDRILLHGETPGSARRCSLDAPVWIISDEIYEKFIYDGVAHTSIASLGPELKRKTIVINGVSKSHAMTGWRIGYAAGPEDLIQAMANVQSQSTSNPTSISQKAAAAALQGSDEFIKTMVAEFDRRRLFVVEQLNQIRGIRCPRPVGSFYVFPNIKGLIGTGYKGYQIKGSTDLASFLLEEGGISTIPGEAFGAEGYLRLSYAVSREVLSEGVEKLKNAVLKLS